MFGLFKGSQAKTKFDRSVLRKNDISLLTLDERWNNLFKNTQKTSDIESCETKLKELLKEQSRLITETKEISRTKKLHMDKILKLTPKVFEERNEQAIKEMQVCEKEIKRINDRMEKINQELEDVPIRIKEANIELLELTVSLVYFKIRKNQKRVNELDKLIDETRTKLKEYISEKESLSQDDSDIYSYFHDLLGGEELEKLDKEFFKE